MRLAQLAISESGHHGAHVHGEAEMTLVVEGQSLHIELTAPAMSIVGFEHRAQSPAQIDAVRTAREVLRNAADIFGFVGVQCDLQAVELDFAAVWDEASAHGAGHAEHHARHDAVSEPQSVNESHSDISANYSFLCTNERRLEAVSVGQDELPFGLQAINAMWVSESSQGAAALTAAARVIELN